MTISEKNIEDRIEWIKEASADIRDGDIISHRFSTDKKASRLSQLAAGEIPFLKAKVDVEDILFIDFDVKSELVNKMYIAQPMFTGIIGAGCKDYPIQVGCITDYKIPNTVATHKKDRKHIYFVSEEEKDPFLKHVIEDGEMTKLTLYYTHIINKNEKMNLVYGMQVIPQNSHFKNKTLCTISSGTVRKTLSVYGKRVYDIKNYLKWLESIIRNLKEFNYTGPIKRNNVYDNVYFAFHPIISNVENL